MARVSFTRNLQQHVACPPGQVSGATVREVLEEVFTQNPRARSYVLDEHGRLRKHMNVFVNGAFVKDRVGLSDPVTEACEVYVMQALSGG
jgi:sulfur-carrier protein